MLYMMREQDNHIETKKDGNKAVESKENLSDTIEDAHAAGDGALERGKDSLIASDDDDKPDATKPGEGEAY